MFSQIYTPLPAAKLSALITIGCLAFFIKSIDSFALVKTPKFAVGILYFLQRFLVNIFDPSSCEAFLFGPKTLILKFSK